MKGNNRSRRERAEKDSQVIHAGQQRVREWSGRFREDKHMPATQLQSRSSCETCPSLHFSKDWFRDGENRETGVVSVSRDVFCDDGFMDP